MNKVWYLFFLMMSACASAQNEHMRDLLQLQNPECEVDEDLNLKCPLPMLNNGQANELED